MIWVTRDSVGDSDKVDSFYSLTRIVNFQYIDHAGFFFCFLLFLQIHFDEIYKWIMVQWKKVNKSLNTFPEGLSVLKT